VHQSKLTNDFVLLDVHPGVHKEEVHLHEREQHVQYRVDALQNIIILTLWVDLEEVD